MDTSSSSDIFLSPFSDMDLSSSFEIALSSSEIELSSSSDIVILKNTDSDLTKLVAKLLGVKSGDCTIFHKTNAENMAAIADLVRGKDIYIIQTGTKDANTNIMELLIKACACKTSSARSIVALIPYLPYSKECKMLKRGCIVTKLLSNMLSTSGLSHVITMDGKKEIQDFFEIPVDNLSANSYLMQYIKGSIPDYRNAVIVSYDPNAAKKAKLFADKLRLKIAVMHGEQNEAQIAPKKVANSKKGAADDPYKKELNKVESKIAVIVLDVIETDSYQGLKQVALKLKNHGASAVYVLATHYCLKEIPSRDFLSTEHIYMVVVSNTLPIENVEAASGKLKVIDVSEAFAVAMRNTKKSSKDNQNSKPISELMCDLSLNK